MRMLMNIVPIVLNAVFFIVLNTEFYTNKAMMPNGQYREWHRSPVNRLYIADQSFLYYLQIVLAAVSVITAILLLFGVRSDIIKKIRLIATIGSVLVFVIIMVVTSNTHVKYS